MIPYTGHPLVDVGLATLTAFANKQNPQDLTEADLAIAVEYMEREYTRQPMKSFLTVAFPNSGFTQPAFEKTPERRLDYARRVLGGYSNQAPVLEEICVFTGEPALAMAFGDKEELPLGRAFRQHIPLATGENVINFHPYGDAGVPVSGKAMLAIQAFPLGCAKVGGRMLAVHSDNHAILLHFASTFLTQNRRLIQLAQEAGSTKLEEAQYGQRTLLIDTLLQARQWQLESQEDQAPFSITAYHLTNSGQGVGLDIYHLPMQTVSFLGDMYRAGNRAAWTTIVQRAWQVAPPRKKGGAPATDFQPRRNYLYDDLFDLPNNAHAFLRTYFLRIALRSARTDQGDPRTSYSLREDAATVSWNITASFLERIMNMDRERVEQIRQLGDQLADYVSTENDRRFFREFFTQRRYDFFRNTLIKANIAYVRRGKPPFITLDPYIEVFESGDEVARSDWQLARDLVLIRMVERLHQSGWLGRNLDVVATEVVAADPEESADVAV